MSFRAQKKYHFLQEDIPTPEMHPFPDTLNFPVLILITFVVSGLLSISPIAYKLHEGKTMAILFIVVSSVSLQHPAYSKCPRNISWHEQMNDYLEAIF